MAEAFNVPEATSDRGTRRRDSTGRPGSAITFAGYIVPEIANAPAICPVCDRTYTNQVGLATHRMRITSCNPGYRRKAYKFNQKMFLAIYYLLYATKNVSLMIAYGMAFIYFTSNCSPLKFHPGLSIITIGILESFALRPLHRFLRYLTCVLYWAKESYHGFQNL